MLELNKKPGDQLTAAEVNQIGAAVDQNTEALNSALFISPEPSEPVEQPEVNTADRAIADEDGNNIKETYLSRGVQSLTPEQQAQVQTNIGVKNMVDAVGVGEPQLTTATVWKNAYRVAANGAITSASNYAISESIKVNVGDLIIFSGFGTTGTGVLNEVQNDEAHTYIRNLELGNNNGTQKRTFLCDKDMYIEYCATTETFVDLIIIPVKIASVIPLPKGGYHRDLYEAAGAVYNEETGYYELNGLTNITEAQMAVIYNKTNNWLAQITKAGAFTQSQIRTNILNDSDYDFIGNVYNGNNAFQQSTIEILAIKSNETSVLTFENASATFLNCIKLKEITKPIKFNTNTFYKTFDFCNMLVNCRIKALKGSVGFPNSSLLSKDSILYIIQNSEATSAITITLHPDAYSMAMTDPEIQAALEEKTYVSLASA